jgi:2-oxo-4-hydroxy-4-carboxy-5-ureidoimidazoline decarboxylase
MDSLALRRSLCQSEELRVDVSHLNELNEEELVAKLLACAGSSRWATEMARQRPFKSKDQLFLLANETYARLSEKDWREAFSQHPKIGDLDALKMKYAGAQGAKPSSADSWSQKEQAAVGEASDEILRALAAGNDSYEKKFGFIFIVCATGKSAGEMLELLEKRIGNDQGQELKNAAEENRKITLIRLEKLCQEARSLHTS